MLLDALASTPADVARAAGRTDDPTGRARPAGGEWSVTDILNHLVDVEERYRARLRTVAEQERPVLAPIAPDETRHDPHATCQQLAARFCTARAETLAFLRALPRGGWARMAVHQSLTQTRMVRLVRDLVEHDVAHLAQLVDTRSKATAARTGDAV